MQTLKASLVSLWLGAALFFSAAVAPAAFNVLRAVNGTELAGTIVSLTLRVINVAGFATGVILLLLTLLFRKPRGVRFFVEALLLLVLAATNAVGHWIVAARMSALRLAMKLPVSDVPLHDPNRVAFDRLHLYSVALLSAGMIAAIIFVAGMMSRQKYE